ncbi:hypothetical protein [Pseudomonas sp. 34 E 7]|nr:hypothetical protein [Pseudomonas sp. 34 E 7]
MVDQVRTLAHVERAIGGDGQTELFQGVGALGMGEQFIHQLDGTVEDVRVLLGQAHHAGVEGHHVVTGHAHVEQALVKRGVENAFVVVAVPGVEGVAQQRARLHALEQGQGGAVKKRVGVDQQRHRRFLQHLAQHHVLGAKVITVGFAPAFAGGFVQGAHAYRQQAIGFGVVAEYLDVHGRIGVVLQEGQRAGDAEYRFLVVGLGAEDQVDQLRTGSGRHCIHGLRGSPWIPETTT